MLLIYSYFVLFFHNIKKEYCNLKIKRKQFKKKLPLLFFEQNSVKEGNFFPLFLTLITSDGFAKFKKNTRLKNAQRRFVSSL
jgi:hypothetical protein